MALERWAATRRVVVVAPSDAEGSRRLLEAGARGVIVVGGELPPIAGTERYEGVPTLPVGDATIDMVVCFESYATLGIDERHTLQREAYRVLRPGGLFAAWIRHPPGPDDRIDFWTLEEELSSVFEHINIVAQMPWHGYSLAPVLDEEPEAAAPSLTLDEGLLLQPPEASHYLAVAFRQRPLPKLVERLTAECLLVPVPREESVEAAGVEALAVSSDAPAQIRDLEEQVEALRMEVERAKEKGLSSERQLRQAREELRRYQARVEEQKLNEDGRVSALREEMAEVRARAQLLEDDLEGRLSVLREQGEQSEQRAILLEQALLEARSDDTGERLEVLRQQLNKSEAAYEAAETDRVELEAQLRTKVTDLTVLTGTVKDLEQSLVRMSERADARARELETQAANHSELNKRYEALSDERDELIHQVEVGIAEREGARQLAARVEAELEQLRRRYAEQQDSLAHSSQEASRLSGELQALKERLLHQETMLDQTRSRAEELSATAAKGYEQGRMLTEVARDRDHLREELTRRSSEIDRLEERLWETREEVQKERLEVVRLGADVERLREQAERAREAEQARNREVEQLNKELRKLEVERADTQGLLRSRDEQLERLRGDLGSMSGDSADLAELRADLQLRSRDLSQRTEQLQQARAREQDALALVKRYETQLGQANAELEEVRQGADEAIGLSAGLRSELDVKALEAEHLAASVADLQRQHEELRAERRQAEASAEQLQRRIEREASEQESLRRRLRAREQELEAVVSTQESSGAELYRLKRELESVAQSNEQLDGVARLQPDVEEGPTLLQEQQWPEEAIAELRRLKGLVAEQARQHAEQLARLEGRAGAGADATDDGTAAGAHRQIRLLELEVNVRAEEQEHVLGLLEGAEQKIWEMTDAADRNAARLAAGLAQLEKHKEQIDELHDELEVSRNLLAAAQARALEQERLLASERAKLARAGIGPDGLPPTLRGVDAGQEVDDLFAELEMSGSGAAAMIDLETTRPDPDPGPVHASGAVQSSVADRNGTSASSASRSSSRMVIEAIEDEDDWPEPAAELEAIDHEGSGPITLGKSKSSSLPPPPSVPPGGPRVTLVRDSANDAKPDAED